MQTVAVLCIDDNETGLKLRKLVLERSGYKVVVATTGQSGIQAFAENEIDIVLLDYEMPDMNGGLVAHEMRRMKPHVPIVMLSGSRCLPPSVCDLCERVLVKGEPTKILLDAVSTMTQRSRASLDE